MLPVARFLYFSKADLLEEIERVAALTNKTYSHQGIELNQEICEIKQEQIGLLVYHFKLLTGSAGMSPKPGMKLMSCTGMIEDIFLRY